MSELTKLVRGGFTEDCDYTGDSALVQDLCMVHEILEAEHETLGNRVKALEDMLMVLYEAEVNHVGSAPRARARLFAESTVVAGRKLEEAERRKHG